VIALTYAYLKAGTQHEKTMMKHAATETTMSTAHNDNSATNTLVWYRPT